MKNYALSKDLKSGVFKDSSLKITKGNVGDFSIEVENPELNSVDSYLYKNENDRDSDYNELKKY
jgi:hypothetical protein